MTLQGVRWCQVLDRGDAEALAQLLDALGLEQLADLGLPEDQGFVGAVFPARGTGSWVEVWPSGEGMEVSSMLQLVVDDADATAERARAAGYELQGPMDDHGERIYVVAGPGGMNISFQSPLPPG